ncbi:MAG: chemotaxis-specific protein-glutamate methyltransferase CheB [Salinivirgaceae bacterium]|nr:chemotaxis-specific protein-glutamate methyltransferase CheB [Salinivirgaceae bacterium]
MIKVLIVEDSRVVSEYLEFILSNDPAIEVIGNVSNGKAAIDFIENQKPDIITMDVDMPIMNGLEATRIIMSTNPIPIIVVTASRNSLEMNITMEALAAGALSVIDKPLGIGHQNEQERTEKLLSMVKVLSEVKVIRRIPKKNNKIAIQPSVKLQISFKKFNNKKIVAVGISSGGPHVLERIFSKITSDFPYPIVVVQHITEGFIDGLAKWLNGLLQIPVHLAKLNESLLPGNMYFAPDKHHMQIRSLKVKLVTCGYEPGKLCPSVEQLFHSLSLNHAPDTIAMIMTGMGKDGAEELKLLREAGAITIAQNKESSLVHGMPGEAIKIGAAEYVLSPDEIANLLFEIEKHANEIKRSVNESKV